MLKIWFIGKMLRLWIHCYFLLVQFDIHMVVRRLKRQYKLTIFFDFVVRKI